MTTQERQVAITGIGLLSALGDGRQSWLERLQQPPDETPAPRYDPRSESLAAPAGPLFVVDSVRVARALGVAPGEELPDDPELRLAAAASLLALADAGQPEPPANAALVATYETPGMDVFLRGLVAQAATLGEQRPESPEALWALLFEVHQAATYGTHSFIHLHHLARRLGIHGRTLFVNNACASGLHALDEAALWVATGRVDLAVVAAAESPRVPAKRQWFEAAGLHSTDGHLRPFDAHRTGLILGEGAAAFVLEPTSQALARGAKPRWAYLGGGFQQEGWKVTLPNFSEPYHERAVRQALAAARLVPSDVDVVVAHGAGTHLSDAYEARGLASVFGQTPQRPLITALKGWFGHTLGACALLEAGAAMIALENGLLPGTAGFTHADARLPVVPVRETRPHQTRILLKVANGFAGFNAAAVFERIA